MSKKQNNQDSGDDLLLFWFVFFFQTKKTSLSNEIDQINLYDMSIACHQSSSVSLKKERERERQKKKPEKERDQPTVEDLHESCHLTLIDSNYDTNKIS